MAESLMFQVGIDTQDYQKGFKKMSNINNDFNKGLKTLGKTLMGVFAGVGLKNAISTTTKAFLAQEKAEKRLESITKSVTGATDEQIKSMKALASSLQNVGVIGDEVSLSGMSQLATFKLNTESIKQLTPALQTLAVAQYGTNVSQEQIIQTANMLGKSYMGMEGALQRVGVTLTDYQKEILNTGTEQERVATLTEIVSNNFGDLNKAMRNTSAGALQAFNNAWGDLLEVIGSKITPILVNLANTMTDSVIPALAAFVNDPIQGLKQIYERMNLISKVVLGITTAFIGLQVAGKAWTLLTNIIKVGSGVIVGVFKTIFSWPAILAAAVYTFSVAWRNDWGGIQEKTENVWNAIKPIISNLWEGLKNLTGVVIDWTFNLLGDAWDWLLNNSDMLKEAIKGSLEWLVNTGSQLITFTLNLTGDLWEFLKNTTTSLYEFIFGKDLKEDNKINFELNLTKKEVFQNAIQGALVGAGLSLIPGVGWGLAAVITIGVAVGGGLADSLRKQYLDYEEQLNNLVPTFVAYNKDTQETWTFVKEKMDDVKLGMIEISKKEKTLFTDLQLVFGEISLQMLDLVDNVIVAFYDGFEWIANELSDKFSWVPGVSKKKNGDIPKFANGNTAYLDRSGFIHGTGTGTSDSNLAWLSDGEAVINAKSTKKYGHILKAINENKFSIGNIPKFVNGNTGNIGNYASNFINTLSSDWNFITEKFDKLYSKMGLNIDSYDIQNQQITALNKEFEGLETQTIKITEENTKLNEQLKKQEDLQKQYNDTLQKNINNFQLGTNGEDMASEGLSSFFKNVGGTIKTEMSNVFSEGGELVKKGLDFLPALGNGLSSAFSSLLSSLGPITLIAWALGNIFSGIIEVLQPLVAQILDPIVNILKSFGMMIGSVLSPILKGTIALMQITLIPALKALSTAFNGVAAFFEWAGDQILIAVNGFLEFFDWVPGVEPFLSEKEKKHLSRGIGTRFDEKQEASKGDYDTNFSNKPMTGGGDTYQAGSTQNITNNTYISIDGEFATSGQLEDLAETIANKISNRKDLSGKIVIAGGGA